MQQMGTSILQLDLFPLWEWDEIRAVIYRYRGRVALSPAKKRDLIAKAVTNEWLGAERIARLSGLPEHCCRKLLVKMALSGDVEAKEECWIDARKRERKRCLYRKPQDIQGSMDVLMRAFGMVSAEMRTEAEYLHCRKHLLGE